MDADKPKRREAWFLNSKEAAEVMGFKKRQSLASYRYLNRDAQLPFFRLSPYPYGRLRFIMSDAVNHAITRSSEDVYDSDMDRLDLDAVSDATDDGGIEETENRMSVTDIMDGLFGNDGKCPLTPREEKVIRMRFGIEMPGHGELPDIDVGFSGASAQCVDWLQRYCLHPITGAVFLPKAVRNIIDGKTPEGHKLKKHMRYRDHDYLDNSRMNATLCFGEQP